MNGHDGKTYVIPHNPIEERHWKRLCERLIEAETERDEAITLATNAYIELIHRPEYTIRITESTVTETGNNPTTTVK